MPDKNEKPRLNLLQAVVKSTHLPWYWFAVLVTSALLLFLIIATLLDGEADSFNQWDFWRQFLGAPLLVGYIFLIFPYMQKLSNMAINTFIELQINRDADPTESVFLPRRRWEWTAFTIGAAFWVLIQVPWRWEWGEEGWWLYLYALITFAILFGLLGWLIYYSFAESGHINKLSRRKLNINIFDTAALTPVARSSLGTSFAFIGGISISLFFQTVDSLLTWTNITIYSVLVLATLLIFFLSIWSTHRTMADAKHEELSLVRRRLEECIRQLRNLALTEQSENNDQLNTAVAAWGTYESRVREVREWPFNADILRRLGASILVPGAVYLIKVLIGTRIM
ncbi:MAG: hypothetical protein PVG61_04585 [Dehalococcoidia bacterium]